jgi:hypothetical protein
MARIVARRLCRVLKVWGGGTTIQRKDAKNAKVAKKSRAAEPKNLLPSFSSFAFFAPLR